MKNSPSRWLFIGLILISHHIIASDLQPVVQTNVFYPFSHAEYRSNLDDNENLDEFEVEYGSDFFYLLNYKYYRVVGELLLTNNEFELERLKFGVDFNNNNTLWIGKFQIPLGYWNTNYHSGPHLQTSVHRPSIVEFEDKGGVLPTRITGIKLDGQHYTNDGVLKYSVAVGFSPILNDEPTLYYSNSTNNDWHNTIKIGYQPDETNPSEFGLALSQSIINSEYQNINHIRQKILGIYTHHSWEKARLTASGFFVHNTLFSPLTNEASDSFMAGYTHVEYDILNSWITYARYEGTLSADNDPYLNLFQYYQKERILSGIRFEFSRRQAISVEISQRKANNRHTHFTVQWSGVFP